MTAQEIVNLFAADVKQSFEKAGQQPSAKLGELEAQVRGVVMRLGRVLLSSLFEQATSSQKRPRCGQCGAPMRGHGRRPRTFATLLGDVTVRLPRYRCARCGQESCPALALCDGRLCCSSELWPVALELAVQLPYRTVEALLSRLGVALSDSTIEQLVNEVGGELSARDEAAQAAVAEGCVEPLGERVERMYLMVDGRSVRVDGEWREMKAGTIFVTRCGEPDALGRWPAVEKRSRLAMVAGADEFCERFFAEARRRGLWSAREVVIVADGAQWIWDRLPGFVPVGQPRVEILDFYHAAEHVGRGVDAACGAGSPRAKFWSDHLRGQLRAGEWRDVVRALERLRDEQRSPDRRHQVQLTVDYLLRHSERIDYFLRHWQGYYIGSGQMESICKQLGLRFKGCGMNWSADGLKHLLAVHNHLHRYPRQPLPAAA